MDKQLLWQLGEASIRELETEAGILASGRAELFGCIFGRDSLISALGFLAVYERTGQTRYLTLVGKILRSLAKLQGTSVQIESGEEPGKIIHEYRPDNHAHLTARTQTPEGLIHDRSWFVYPEGEMRNYDTVDATPLFLIATHEYMRLGGEVEPFMPNIRAALVWIKEYGDSNGDGFVDYQFAPERAFGGLLVQSWMDSSESLFYERPEKHMEGRPPYPIAPVEVQAYVWSAYTRWGEYLGTGENREDSALGRELKERAHILKKKFNESFALTSHGAFRSLAYALDGSGTPLSSPRSSMAHVLWASYGGVCILEETRIPQLVKRLLAADLFVSHAGIRTLSRHSRVYDPLSYHNGSIWPHDTAMLAEGLHRMGYEEEAGRVHRALLKAYRHFKAPVELFGYRRGFRPYEAACQTQAWSAAALLVTLSSYTQ